MSLVASFIDYSTSFMMARIEAEIYMRIYQYAAEDFRATSDCQQTHAQIQTWQVTTEANVNAFSTNLVSHIHGNGNMGSPTTPPMGLAPYISTPASLIPLNTTARIDNIAANYAIPSVTLSYVDLSMSGMNFTQPTFRRGFQIPIAYGPISQTLKTE